MRKAFSCYSPEILQKPLLTAGSEEFLGFRSGSLRTEKMQKDTEKAQRYFTDGHGFAQRDSYINLEMDSGV
jgi:hypothetical protein